MKIIAHRGASAYAPENTLDSFRLALEMGSRDFEFDVHRTKDGVLVVHHDYFIMDGKERKVYTAKTSFEDLRKIDVSRTFIGADFHCVPTFEEVLDVLSEKAEWINIELKNDGNKYPGIEAQVLEVVNKKGLLKKVLISSFDFPTLKRMRDLSPTIAIGYLVEGRFAFLFHDPIEKAKEIDAENLHIDIENACERNVNAIREAGLRCCVYTVNRKEDALRLKELGVDGIFSNFPDILGDWNLKP